MPRAWNIVSPSVKSPGKVSSGATPAETEKGVVQCWFVFEVMWNCAHIKASFVIFGPFPPIPAIWEDDTELYVFNFFASEVETKQEEHL